MGSVAAAQGLSCPEVWRIFPDQELNLCPPTGSGSKESACNELNLVSIPGLERSPGEGNGYPLQYSCLKNSMDRGAFLATVHRVAKRWIWLSDTSYIIYIYTHTHIYIVLSICLSPFLQIQCLPWILIPEALSRSLPHHTQLHVLGGFQSISQAHCLISSRKPWKAISTTTYLTENDS